MKPQLYSVLYADGDIEYGVWTRKEVVERGLRLADRELRENHRMIVGYVCIGEPPPMEANQ